MLYVVGEHADKYVRADSVVKAVVDGTNVQVDGFKGAKGVFELLRFFVVSYEFGVGYVGFVDTASDDVEPVDGGFGADFFFITLEG